jgi:hypothetical protein
MAKATTRASRLTFFHVRKGKYRMLAKFAQTSAKRIQQRQQRFRD